jgi:hypothetical protein
MSEKNWKLEGDYFETCNCDTVCPCVFLGSPDQGECNVTVAWHIDKGQFDNTSLDGLNVVAVFHTPGNMWTGPKWKAALYLDERATKEQADALGKIYSGKAGGFFVVIAGFIGELAGVRQYQSSLKWMAREGHCRFHLPLISPLKAWRELTKVKK